MCRKPGHGALGRWSRGGLLPGYCVENMGARATARTPVRWLLYQSRQERGAAGPGVAAGQRAEGRVGPGFADGQDARVSLAEI